MSRATSRIVFAPYALRVSATRELARMFDSFCILPEGSRFRARRSDLIVNWGRSDLPDYANGVPARVLNGAQAVRQSVNKLATFRAFHAHSVPTVEWTTDTDVAQEWCKDGAIVIGRSRVAGRGGAGIHIWYGQTPNPTAPICPLYTKYAKRRAEYRVHVFRGAVIDVQQKKRRSGAERTQESSIVRSYANGWVFCRDGVEAPPCVLEASVAAVAALGLDFGGVDVGYNQHYDQPYVYEVNSAPGIEGTTLDKYFNAIKELRT